MELYKKLYNFFSKLEDNTRSHLARHPIIYSILGSIFLILLWRGIWHTADLLEGEGGIWAFIFHPFVSVTWATWGLLLIGLFVSMFVGDMIIMSGIKKTKKATEKTELDIKKEESKEEYILEHIEEHLNRIESEVKEVERRQDVIDKKNEL